MYRGPFLELNTVADRGIQLLYTVFSDKLRGFFKRDFKLFENITIFKMITRYNVNTTLDLRDVMTSLPLWLVYLPYEWIVFNVI